MCVGKKSLKMEAINFDLSFEVTERNASPKWMRYLKKLKLERNWMHSIYTD